MRKMKTITDLEIQATLIARKLRKISANLEQTEDNQTVHERIWKLETIFLNAADELENLSNLIP